MISKIRGVCDEIDGDDVVVDANGVGYAVTCSRTVTEHLAVGDPVTLFIESKWREGEGPQLFGFQDRAERILFRLLNSVQGVGGKTALALLGHLGAEGVIAAIDADDTKTLSGAKGIGGATARRVAAELKTKIDQVPLVARRVTEQTPTVSQEASRLIEDAVSALVNLGYARIEAVPVVRQAAQTTNATLGNVIRDALAALKPAA